MKMLRLCSYDYSQSSPSLNTISILDNAQKVKISHEINGEYSLTFEIPYGDKAKDIKCNTIIDCEGQLFKVMNITRNCSDTDILTVDAWHIFIAESKFMYYENVGSSPSFIGKNPRLVLEHIFNGTPFHVLSDSEASELGMTNIGSDGFLIDFESEDKITAFDVVEKVRECCGKGELYLDNYNIALVERIGNDSIANFNISKTMTNITVTEDISELITRLYPYNNEDVPIGTKTPGGANYIDSDNIDKYGVRAGTRTYEYENVIDIYNAALFDFGKTIENKVVTPLKIIDVDNPNRIDVPSLNISGTFVDLSRISEYKNFHKLNLGDGVTVHNGDMNYKERIIRMERYPYEPELGSLSIGKVKKDLYFYFAQMNKKIKKASKKA